MSCIEEKFYSIFDKLLPFFIRLVEADFSTVFDDCSGLLMKVIKKSLNEGSIPSHTDSVFWADNDIKVYFLLFLQIELEKIFFYFENYPLNDYFNEIFEHYRSI